MNIDVILTCFHPAVQVIPIGRPTEVLCASLPAAGLPLKHTWVLGWILPHLFEDEDEEST